MSRWCSAGDDADAGGAAANAAVPANSDGDFDASGPVLGRLEDPGKGKSIEVGDADGEGAVGDAFYALGDAVAGGAVAEGAVGDATVDCAAGNAAREGAVRDASVGGAQLAVPMVRVLQVVQRVCMRPLMPMLKALLVRQ